MPAPRPVAIVGLMGTGKTSVGSLLAAKFDRVLRDSDPDLYAVHRLSASDLLARHGAEHLHHLESEHLIAALRERPPPVVCAAASVIDRDDCRAALAAALVIWLDAPVAVLVDRFDSATHRPRFADDLTAMLTEQDARRRPLFRAVADLVIDVSVTAAENAAQQISDRLADEPHHLDVPRRR